MAVDLQQAIEILESGNWLSLEVIQANLNKGTGGKLLSIPKCRIARTYNQPTSYKAQKMVSTKSRCANHSLNFTRNVQLPNKSIVTIHPILITTINNHQVI